MLKGERAVVDKKRDRKAHLDERGAELLLRRALETYEAVHQNWPTQLACRSQNNAYWPEELSGFRKALGDIRRSDFLALEHLDHRFMRFGKEPPLRGTVISLADTHHVLYTQGYVPFSDISRFANPESLGGRGAPRGLQLQKQFVPKFWH